MYRVYDTRAPERPAYRIELFNSLAHQWQTLRSPAAPYIERFSDLEAALQRAQEVAQSHGARTRVINARTGKIMRTYSAQKAD